MAELKDRLREALRESGMKAIDLSKKTGIDKGALSHYMKGSYIPKTQNIRKLAEALNVDEGWLLGYDVEKERKTEEEILKKSNDLRDEMSRKMIKHIQEIYNRMPFDIKVDIYEAVRKIEAEEEERHGSKEA